MSEPRVNGRIRAERLRVVDEAGLIGELGLAEALQMARERGLDLVEIGPTTNPPVAKIMDYGKYRYAQKKKLRQSTPKNNIIKEIRARVSIDLHDVECKRSKVHSFLKEGYRVKITISFQGREFSHPEIGQAVMSKMLENIAAHGKIEQEPVLKFPYLSAVVAP